MAAVRKNVQTIAEKDGTPFESVSQALSALTTEERSLSLIYLVQNGSTVDRYFFKDGVDDADFTIWETEGGSSTPAYSAYIATLSQSSNSIPTAVVHNSGEENFISGITLGRNGAGDYEIVKTGAFPVGKTWIMFAQGAPTSALAIANMYRVNDNAIGFSYTKISDGTGTDNFTDLAIEIRVYP